MKISLIIICCIRLLNPITAQELKTYTSTTGDEKGYEDIWISLNGGCSLSCAIGWKLSTTSSLADHDTISYKPENMNDGNKNTSWVEGKKGYGIGEKIIITFDSTNTAPGIPFNGIIISNGYAKSKSDWKNNSRVKTFKVYHNGVAMFFIKLNDSIFPQWVNWDRNFLISSGDIVELEIVDVYKGSKYKDTAISDLSLNGAH